MMTEELNLKGTTFEGRKGEPSKTVG